MGKTKTAFIGGVTEGEKTGKDAYEEKRKRKEAEAKKAQIAGVGLKGGERIAVVSGEAIQEEPAEDTGKGKETSKRAKHIKQRSSKYKSARSKVDKAKLYSISDAIKILKDITYTKFDSTLELHLLTKKGSISQRVSLPHFSGKTKNVEVADDTTIENLKKGKVEFDILLATADMMPKLVPFAKILGPKGLMPNPKAGTLIKTKKDAEKFSGNAITVKTEKDAPVIHTAVGKISQDSKELEENIEVVISAVSKKQIEKAYLNSTMSPSVKIKVS